MRKLTAKLFIVSLIVVLLASLLANMANTSLYSVNVQRISFKTDKGVLSGLLYLPKGASKDDPRPTIVTTHGYLNSAEMQDAPAVELSKRGYVVLALDMYEHGHSVNTVDKKPADVFFSFWPASLFDAVQYMYKQDYVLKDAKGNGIIAVSGHSMGGFSTTMAVVMDEQQFATTGIRKISASLAAGADFTYTTYLKVTEEVANAAFGQRTDGIIASHYDEFFFDAAAQKTGSTVVYKDYLKQAEGQAFLGNPANPQPGQFYTLANGGKRVIYTPSIIHPWDHFSPEATKDQIEFYSIAFAGFTTASMKTIPATIQTWWLKEGFEFIALLGFFFMFMLLASLLINRVKMFAGLNKPTESLVAGPKSTVQKIVYWLIIVSSAAFPAFFFPTLMDKQAHGLLILQRASEVVIVLGLIMLVLTLVKDKGKAVSRIVASALSVVAALVMYVFTTTSAKLFVTNAYFNEPTTNQFVFWALMCSLFAVIVISFVHYFDRSRNPEFDNRQYGLSASVKNIVLALVVAVVLLVAGYAVLYFVDLVFKTDFRFWVWAVKTFEPAHVVAMLKYAPLFFVFYFVNAVAVNLNTNNKYVHGWKGYVVAFSMNVGGLILWLAYQYGKLFATGVGGIANQALNGILLFALIPTLVVATIFTKVLYKKTGNVYLAAFLNTLLMTMITVANTIMYTAMIK